ncbi:MAG: 50S ribosomal protein L23 [Patescibacteria group bacterium]
MTALLRKRQEEEKESNKQDKEKKSGSKKTGKKKKLSPELKANADLVSRTLISPIVSEDAMSKNNLNKYVFKVGKDANKKQVAQAVEAFYGVDVTKVNVLRKKPENHTFRMRAGKKKGFKKAVVTIKSGQEIKLFNE